MMNDINGATGLFPQSVEIPLSSQELLGLPSPRKNFYKFVVPEEDRPAVTLLDVERGWQLRVDVAAVVGALLVLDAVSFSSCSCVAVCYT